MGYDNKRPMVGMAVMILGTLPAMAQADGPVVMADASAAITVTATRIPQSVQDVPATVSVIDEQKIADEIATDVKDLIRFEPGVSVRRAPTRFGAAQGTTGRDGNAGFNIRGLDGNRVLVQVDGIRVPDESVLNSYVKSDDYDVQAGDAYWAATKDYWAAVRAEWDAAIKRGSGVSVVEVAETGSASGARLMGFAEDVQAKKLTTAAAIGKARAVIAEVTKN